MPKSFARSLKPGDQVIRVSRRRRAPDPKYPQGRAIVVKVMRVTPSGYVHTQNGSVYGPIDDATKSVAEKTLKGYSGEYLIAIHPDTLDNRARFSVCAVTGANLIDIRERDAALPRRKTQARIDAIHEAQNEAFAICEALSALNGSWMDSDHKQEKRLREIMANAIKITDEVQRRIDAIE